MEILQITQIWKYFKAPQQENLTIGQFPISGPTDPPPPKVYKIPK